MTKLKSGHNNSKTELYNIELTLLHKVIKNAVAQATKEFLVNSNKKKHSGTKIRKIHLKKK